jgi:hypothetical protein
VFELVATFSKLPRSLKSEEISTVGILILEHFAISPRSSPASYSSVVPAQVHCRTPNLNVNSIKACVGAFICKDVWVDG